MTRLAWVVVGVLVASAPARAQTWTASATLKRQGTPSDQSLGISLSVGRDAILVAAYQETGAVTNAGAVYVFSGPQWSDMARIETTNIGEFEGFGKVVSLDGDQALISNGWIDNAKLWVYAKVGGVWTQKQRIQDNGTGAFGFRLILRGDLALIAAPKDTSDTGKIHIYRRAGDTWSQTQEVTASDAMVSDFFGYGMDYDGQHLAVGASGNLLGPTRTGVYTYALSGNTFVEDGRLVGPEPMEISFGSSVAVSGDTLVVSAMPGRDRMKNGRAYVFVRGAQDWEERQIITKTDEDRFPIGASLQGGTLWLTAVTGMTWNAYAYRQVGGAWTEIQKITVQLATQTWPTLAATAGTMAIGVPYDGAQGHVEVFRNPTDDPTPTGGTSGTQDAGGNPPGQNDGSAGCGCAFANAPAFQDGPWVAAGLVVAGVYLRRRHRRKR